MLIENEWTANVAALKDACGTRKATLLTAATFGRLLIVSEVQKAP